LCAILLYARMPSTDPAVMSRALLYSAPTRSLSKLAKWETLTPDEKKLFIRQADVFAAYTAYTDHEIGRVIQAVEDMGKLDNTLIIYIAGDNGTSAEAPNEVAAIEGVNLPVAEQLKFYDVWGSALTTPHMAVGWTWAFDTPFKWTKQVASHFGGTRQGMAISWPARIKDVGGMRTQFHHIIDIVPTLLDATGIQAPVMVDGVAQKPIEDVSMAYTFDKANANAPSTRTSQYFEMVGNRAIYHDGWIAATTPPSPPWDLGFGKFPMSSTVTPGSFTTLPTIIRRTTISPARCPTSCATCKSAS
jgi:arylsulfatase A-like enzyme